METNKSLHLITVLMFGLLSGLQVVMVIKNHFYIWSIIWLISYILMTLAILINRPIPAILSCIFALISPIREMIRFMQIMSGDMWLMQSIIGFNMITTLFLITSWILLLIGFIKPHLMKVLGLAAVFFGLAYIVMDYIFHYQYTGGLAPLTIFINGLTVIGIFMIGMFYTYSKEGE